MVSPMTGVHTHIFDIRLYNRPGMGGGGWGGAGAPVSPACERPPRSRPGREGLLYGGLYREDPEL